jgi:hypothetical protein
MKNYLPAKSPGLLSARSIVSRREAVADEFGEPVNSWRTNDIEEELHVVDEKFDEIF